MAIGFPTNTVVLISAVMLGVGAGSWLSLSHGLKRIPASPRLKRTWRWAAAIFLMSWLLVRLALAVNPPGGADPGYTSRSRSSASASWRARCRSWSHRSFGRLSGRFRRPG